jgi:hypothetical protein
MPMALLQREIEAFKRLQTDLEADHMGQWVLFHDGQMIGIYAAFEVAADEAVKRFGNGPFLIRQIGAEPITLPASVMYRPDAR